MHLMEHRYDDARRVADVALQQDPDNATLVKFKAEIAAAEAREQKNDREKAEQAQRDKELAQLRLEREAVTPLPAFDDDSAAAAKLNVFFMKIKHQVSCGFQPLRA